MEERSVPVPAFGESITRRAEPCTPRELFCALFDDLEANLHFLAPAFEFVERALGEPPSLPSPSHGDARAFTRLLVDAALSALTTSELRGCASSWPARVAREFAPVGLSDGIWLRGAMFAHAVETEVGMPLLKQLMLRFGDPGTSEPYAQRYAALLRSLGTPPDAILRWEWEEALPCTQLSYEHALLGLTLGLFPSTFGLELLGFNLWMASVGPCPLLEMLAPRLAEQGACLRYFQQHDRSVMTELACAAIELGLREGSDPARDCQRVARGFAAAQRSYLRWQEAMLGRNVPFTPRDFVLEGMRKKARFAAEHHRDLALEGHNVEALLREGGEAHELLLDLMARSRLVRPGIPERSRLMTYSVSIHGPMFDAFTASEKRDLREWIGSLSEPHASAAHRAPIALHGRYTAPQELESLRSFALSSYGGLSHRELFHCLANVDLHPAIPLFARVIVERVLDKLNAAFDQDPRLNASTPPPYSERGIAQMVAAQHEKNVRSRRPTAELYTAPDNEGDAPADYIGAIFDGCWLQGFVDVRRADFEEYGWLFRIYASEHGDGDLNWNHSRIFRREFSVLGPDVMLPKSDRRLYDVFDVSEGSVAKLAIALNTRRFMPEILGLNLGIEASGVGGAYLDRWKRAQDKGLKWQAFAARLHNSIDNFADGHTKWSLSAVQAFMRRVQDGAPSEVAAHWRRIWRLWRLQDILSHGTDAEKDALAEHLQLRNLAPT